MIRLGNCLDLVDPDNARMLRGLYDDMVAEMKETRKRILKNVRSRKYLDCQGALTFWGKESRSPCTSHVMEDWPHPQNRGFPQNVNAPGLSSLDCQVMEYVYNTLKGRGECVDSARAVCTCLAVAKNRSVSGQAVG